MRARVAGSIPTPVVGNGEPHVRARLAAEVLAHEGFVRNHVGGLDRQAASGGHGVARVDDQVHDHLLEVARSARTRPSLLAGQQLELDQLAQRARQHAIHVRQHVVQI